MASKKFLFSHLYFSWLSVSNLDCHFCRPQVIVNSVCPGLVYTDIARTIANQSLLMRVAVPLYMSILSKSTNYGARFYIAAGRTSKDQHVSNFTLVMQ
jgi:hypothetical protein